MSRVLDFSTIQTPAGDGQTLVCPDPCILPHLVEENRRLLESQDFPFAGLSARECRRLVREAFSGGDDGRFWIVTGHQSEFIHPGVWAKHVVTQRLAEATGGLAANVIVDNDAVKKTTLSVPAERPDGLQVVEVPFATYFPGLPWELLEALSPERLEAFERAVRDAYGERYETSLMPRYFEAARREAAANRWVEQTVAGRRAIDAMFGVRMLERPTSAAPIWPLLAEVLAGAGRFFECYNRALAEYRSRLGIKGNRRPIPDLARDGERLELPLWAVRDGMPRQRVFVTVQGDDIRVFAENEPIGCVSRRRLLDPALAEREIAECLQAGLRPRALTLTIWARLLLADLFIHGIGGAKYDRITDILMAEYFGIEPPAFCCVSATLRLDLPRRPVTIDDARTLCMRLRDLNFNPQRYLPRNDELSVLLAEKLEQIARSEWLRQNRPDDRESRRQVFQRIRTLNAMMLALDAGIAQRMSREYQQVLSWLKQNEIANSREYFIGLFRPADLQRLCDNLPNFK